MERFEKNFNKIDIVLEFFHFYMLNLDENKYNSMVYVGLGSRVSLNILQYFYNLTWRCTAALPS